MIANSKSFYGRGRLEHRRVLDRRFRCSRSLGKKRKKKRGRKGENF